MSSWPFSVPTLRKVWAVPRGTKIQAPSEAFEVVPATLIRKVPFTIQKHSSKLVCRCSGGPAAGGTTSNQVSTTPLVVSPVVFHTWYQVSERNTCSPCSNARRIGLVTCSVIWFLLSLPSREQTSPQKCSRAWTLRDMKNNAT